MSDNFELDDNYGINENYSDPQVFIIGQEKAIPEITGQLLIAGENNAQSINFEMDRYYDGIDISDKQINILYSAPQGYADICHPINVKKGEEKIRFTWVVPAHAVMGAGELIFSVEFVGDDYVLKTLSCILEIEDGMLGHELVSPPEDKEWYLEMQNMWDRLKATAESEEERENAENLRKEAENKRVIESEAALKKATEAVGKSQQVIADCEKAVEEAKNFESKIDDIREDLDNKIEHVGGYKEYDIGTPSVGTYWNKSAKKQLESETYQSFNPISLKAGTYHYENMSGSFTFYEDTDGNWIPIGKYSTSGNGDVVITNDTTMYITEMQKSGVFVGAKLYSGDITQKESNWFKNPKYDIDNINNTLESLSNSVNDIKSIDGSVIKEYCIYVSTTGSDTSGDGSEEKPFATIYHANETITDNSYAKRYRIIVLPGTYTDLQDKYTGIAQTSKYQGVITKPWVTYESKSGNPEDTIIEWNGSTGLENPIRSDIVEKCAFHIVSLPRTFTAIKGFTIKSKNTRYAMHCESSGMGIQGEWLIENCIFDWGGCPNISDDTGRFPAIGIGMSPCEKGTIKFCKIVTTTVETMLVHDGKNKDGNSAVILGAELNFIKCDLGTGRLQFQSIYPKSGEINAKTNNVCNLISCTQINNLYSYISSLNSDDEMVWRVYGKDCDFASYGNMSDYVYKIGTANNVSN